MSPVKKIQRQINQRPVGFVTSIVTIVEATIVLLISFGVQLTAEQTGAILTLVVAIGGVVQSIWLGKNVIPRSNPVE